MPVERQRLAEKSCTMEQKTERNDEFDPGSEKRTVPFRVEPITVIAGHYGVGKTNLALNVAIDSAACGRRVTLIDLDVVNPYFRSSDYRAGLEKKGVTLIAPVYAGSNLDVPSLSGAIEPALEDADENNIVIVDAGGDDAGATALGRFADVIGKKAYNMYYVINRNRNLTQEPQEAVELLKRIEAVSGLEATGVINNSHLKELTTGETLEQSVGFARQSAERIGKPLVAMTVPLGKTHGGPRSFIHFPHESTQTLYLVRIYVNTPWETQAL